MRHDFRPTPGQWFHNNGYIKTESEDYNIASVNSAKTTEGASNAQLLAHSKEMYELLRNLLLNHKTDGAYGGGDVILSRAQECRVNALLDRINRCT